MAVPPSPRNADWQAPRVPKLTYRKALPQNEAEKLNAEIQKSVPTSRVSTASRTESTRTSTTQSTAPFSFNAVPTKKKGSFLSGFFTKEPTLTALAQVEADLTAKHGAATPQNVPHVSSRKMPEHVPKVNTKWDGVPETVKLREREEKQRRRISQRSSLVAPAHSMRSRSSDGPGGGIRNPYDFEYRAGSDTVSQEESWQDPASRRGRRNSMYSTFSDDSQVAYGRHASSVRSQSLRSPSGTSLPEITSFFPHHQKGDGRSAIPHRWQSQNSTNTYVTQSSSQSRSDASQREHCGPVVDSIPEHSTSPVNTPGEMSPVTPNYMSDREQPSLANKAKQETQDKRPQKIQARSKHVAMDAFLAGEAKPMEVNEEVGTRTSDPKLQPHQYYATSVHRVEPDIAKRPDSSRARLGLRASMLVNAETAPWDRNTSGPTSTDAFTASSKGRIPKKLAIFK